MSFKKRQVDRKLLNYTVDRIATTMHELNEKGFVKGFGINF